MGVCKQCIYVGESRPRLHGADFFCMNDNYKTIDFITGEIHNGSCRVNNTYGECLFFDDGTLPPEEDNTETDLEDNSESDSDTAE